MKSINRLDRKCKNTLKSKARLMAEKISKVERKGKAEIHIFSQGDEPVTFWRGLRENEEEDSIEVSLLVRLSQVRY